jgi:hypothetical protein
MAKPAIHTVKRDGVWQNLAEGSTRRIGSTYATKAEAQAAGRERARRDRTEHIIHNVNGTIGQRNSYATTLAAARADPRAHPSDTFGGRHRGRRGRWLADRLAEAIKLCRP